MPATSLWFILSGHSEVGPFTADQLRRFAASGQLRREHQLRSKSDGRLVKAGQTTLFPYEPPTDALGTVPNGTQAPINIDTGFQPAPYGSFRPADGYLAGIFRVASSGPILGFFACVIAATSLVGAVGRQYVGQAWSTRPPHQIEKISSIEEQLSDLKERLVTWHRHRENLSRFVQQLRVDEDEVAKHLEELKGLSGPSLDDPKAKILCEELDEISRQLVTHEKLHDEFDLAIFHAESRIRTLQRQITAQQVTPSDDELEDLRDTVSSFDGSSPPEYGIVLPPLAEEAMKRQEAD